MKGPVRGVMEAVIVGTVGGMRSGMYTRMSQDAQMCVCKQPGTIKIFSVCIMLFIVNSSILPKCLHTGQTKLSL